MVSDQVGPAQQPPTPQSDHQKRGKRQRNTAPKYVQGFRLFDCVRYQGKPCFVFGRRSSGYFDLRALDGTKISQCQLQKVDERTAGFGLLSRKEGGVSSRRLNGEGLHAAF